MKHLNPKQNINTDKELKYLFHGSAFHHEVLMPGYYRSGQLTEWDNSESNKYLYSTTDREEAISLGFASSIEHSFTLDKISINGDSISITTSNSKVNNEALQKLNVYLYTIEFNSKDNWVKNNNEYNNIDTEYKTSKTKIDYLTVEKIDMIKWLKNKKIKIEIK